MVTPMLTAEEMARMKRLVGVVERKPQASRAETHSSPPSDPPASSQQNATKGVAAQPSDTSGQTSVPTRNVAGEGSIAAAPHASNLATLSSARGNRGASPRSARSHVSFKSGS